MYGTRAGGAAGGAGGRSTDAAAARAVEALRRAGGALAVARLHGAVETEGAEALASCLRRRDDLFLLVERPRSPWNDQEWSAAERAEYERTPLPATGEHVLLLDGGVAQAVPLAPAVLRETLLSMWNEAPQDAQIRRELARAAAFGETEEGNGRGSARV